MENKKIKLLKKEVIHFAKLTSGIILGYIALFTAVHLFFIYFFQPQEILVFSTQQGLKILPLFLFSVGLTFSIAVYLFNCWLSKRWLKPEWSKAFLFMGIMAAFGPIAETLGNNLWRIVWGQPLWLYVFLPVHSGNTSVVMSVLWPIYGFHIYCFHIALKARHDITEDSDLSLIFGIDAITVEVFVNLLSLSFFYSYIFYYLAGDLWHLSTAFVFLPYLLFGYLCVKILHFYEKRHHHIIVGMIGFIIGWTIIFSNLKF